MQGFRLVFTWEECQLGGTKYPRHFPATTMGLTRMKNEVIYITRGVEVLYLHVMQKEHTQIDFSFIFFFS